MDSTTKISDASLYTDFSSLQKLRGKVSGNDNTVSVAESREANKEVAKQFESLFLQMMLKSMRDATSTGDSAESDQTRFYQEMFDKQIALDLASKPSGGGLGIAAMLEKDLTGGQQQNVSDDVGSGNSTDSIAATNFELVRTQLNRASAVMQVNNGNSNGNETETETETAEWE